jgi:hypothetical protein
MILTMMILLLLRNASVDVGRPRSRHIVVAIVLVVIRDAMPLNVMHWRTPIIMKTMSMMVPSSMNRRWMTDDNDNDNDDIAFDNVLDNDDDGDDNEEEHNDDLKQQCIVLEKHSLHVIQLK